MKIFRITYSHGNPHNVEYIATDDVEETLKELEADPGNSVIDVEDITHMSIIKDPLEEKAEQKHGKKVL